MTEGLSGYMKAEEDFSTGLNLLNSFTYDGDRGSFHAEKVVSPASNGITILQSGVYRIMVIATIRNKVNTRR